VRAFVQLRELLGSNDRGRPLGHPRTSAPAAAEAPRYRIHRGF
jgi:hypothetical protein